MNIAIIPARGGSKRIPRKNIRIFSGKPIIAWPIIAAKSSNIFDKVIVSTDDDEIAEVSRNNGAEIPFIRPKELSDDFTGTIPVIKHAINFLNKNSSKVENVCCIYATAPFVEEKYLLEGFKELKKNDVEYTFSVTSFPFPIQRAIRISENNRTEMIFPENFNKRSQDFDEIYHDAGQFYWGKSSAWLEDKVLFANHSIPIKIPRYKVQDIDNEEDWIRAENMFNLIKNKNINNK